MSVTDKEGVFSFAYKYRLHQKTICSIYNYVC